MDDGYVLVIGSAGFDAKARPTGEIHWGTSNVGKVRSEIGGVGRNIAENLARLNVETILLSAVGSDAEGKLVLDYCETNGVDCSRAKVVEGARTGSSFALLKPNGDIDTIISDFEIMNALDSNYLLNNEFLIAHARFVVIDSTLSESALKTLFGLVRRYNLQVCADPTSPTLIKGLLPYISQLHLIIPNTVEIAELFNLPRPVVTRQQAMKSACNLVMMGAHIAVVTMGSNGTAYANDGGTEFINGIRGQVVDTTGARDALTSAIILGLLNSVPLDEAIRLGVTAAALTVQTDDNILSNLSQQMLYDQLVMERRTRKND